MKALPTPGKEGGSRSTLVVGVPQIGGSFSLLNHEGVRVTDEDYKGKLALVFGGVLVLIGSFWIKKISELDV